MKELLEEVLRTLQYARIFVTTREKMHHDGISLYDECITKVSDEINKEDPTETEQLQSMVSKTDKG